MSFSDNIKEIRVEFPITLVGQGKTIKEAWNDAIEGFILDPGIPPDENECLVEILDDE